MDIAAYQDQLVNSGVDQKLQDIANKTKEEVAKIEALDIAALSPSAARVTMAAAQATVEATAKVMLDAAADLKPKLPKLQDMMGEVLAGGSPGGVTSLLEKAGGAAAGLPSVDSLSSSALGS